MPLINVDADGFDRTDFAGILDFYQKGTRAIFGKDLYLEPDSQIGALLGLLASEADSTFKALEAVYSSFSPATAVGDGLSRNVKINGIARRVPTNSTVDLRIVGQPGTSINNGVAVDTAGRRWVLIDTAIVIDSSGEVTKTAQAEDEGAITAAAGTITRIGTPTRGWQSVNNPLAATPGLAVETDGELRIRQTESTMIPSRTVMEGVVGAVASIPGVKRHRGYENPTGVTDDDGVPEHCIAIVVEGGDADLIAQVIHREKTAGTNTFARDAEHFDAVIEDRVAPLPGGTTVTVLDEKGAPTDINFIRPTLVPIKVEITINALTGLVDTTLSEIKSLVTAYVNGTDESATRDRLAGLGLPADGFPIGEDVYPGRLYTPVNLDNAAKGLTYFASLIRVAKVGDAYTGDPVTLLFNELASIDSTEDVEVIIA